MTLSEIGNTPVDFAVLKSLFPDHKSVHNKISELEKSGTLIRLKKGMYVCIAQRKRETSIVGADCQSPLWTIIRIYGIGITLLRTDSGERLYHSIDDNQAYQGIQEHSWEVRIHPMPKGVFFNRYQTGN